MGGWGRRRISYQTPPVAGYGQHDGLRCAVFTVIYTICILGPEKDFFKKELSNALLTLTTNQFRLQTCPRCNSHPGLQCYVVFNQTALLSTQPETPACTRLSPWHYCKGGGDAYFYQKLSQPKNLKTASSFFPKVCILEVHTSDIPSHSFEARQDLRTSRDRRHQCEKLGAKDKLQTLRTHNINDDINVPREKMFFKHPLCNATWKDDQWHHISTGGQKQQLVLQSIDPWGHCDSNTGKDSNL